MLQTSEVVAHASHGLLFFAGPPAALGAMAELQTASRHSVIAPEDVCGWNSPGGREFSGQSSPTGASSWLANLNTHPAIEQIALKAVVWE